MEKVDKLFYWELNGGGKEVVGRRWWKEEWLRVKGWRDVTMRERICGINYNDRKQLP